MLQLPPPPLSHQSIAATVVDLIVALANINGMHVSMEHKFMAHKLMAHKFMAQLRSSKRETTHKIEA